MNRELTMLSGHGRKYCWKNQYTQYGNSGILSYHHYDVWVINWNLAALQKTEKSKTLKNILKSVHQLKKRPNLRENHQRAAEAAPAPPTTAATAASVPIESCPLCPCTGGPQKASQNQALISNHTAECPNRCCHPYCKSDRKEKRVSLIDTSSAYWANGNAKAATPHNWNIFNLPPHMTKRVQPIRIYCV